MVFEAVEEIEAQLVLYVKFSLRLAMMHSFVIIVILLNLFLPISGEIQLHTSSIQLFTQMTSPLLHLNLIKNQWFASSTSSHWSTPSPYFSYRPPTQQYFPLSQKPPQAYIVGAEYITIIASPLQQYFDYGATHHVTHNADNVLDNISTTSSDQVLLCNGQGLAITSIRAATFQSSHKPHTTITLQNIVLVPKITKNLISVSQFSRDNNVYFQFHPKTYLLKSHATSEILLQSSLGKDGLYSFGSLYIVVLPNNTHSTHVVTHSLPLHLTQQI